MVLRRAGHRRARRDRRRAAGRSRSPRTTRRGTHSSRSAPPSRPTAPGASAAPCSTVTAKALTPIGKVYPVQIDPARATAATVRELEKVVDEPAGSLVAKLAAATKAGQQGADPRHHLPAGRLRRAQGRARCAQGRHLPRPGTAAGQDAHLRPAVARLVRRRERRADRQVQGPVCRGRLRRGQWPPGAVRRSARWHGGRAGHLERRPGHPVVRQGRRAPARTSRRPSPPRCRTPPRARSPRPATCPRPSSRWT